jgi:hypothetical protein
MDLEEPRRRDGGGERWNRRLVKMELGSERSVFTWKYFVSFLFYMDEIFYFILFYFCQRNILFLL